MEVGVFVGVGGGGVVVGEGIFVTAGGREVAPAIGMGVGALVPPHPLVKMMHSRLTTLREINQRFLYSASEIIFIFTTNSFLTSNVPSLY